MYVAGKHQLGQNNESEFSDSVSAMLRPVHVLFFLILSKFSQNFKIRSEFLRNLDEIKGQLISKCPYGVFKSSKKTMKYFQDFCPSP